MITRQTPRNQTLYADLLQEVLACSFPEGRGLSFTSKRVSGRRYWYLSVAVGRARLQAYLGPDTSEMRQRIERAKARWTESREGVQDRRRLVAHLLGGGGQAILPGAGSVLATLADGGIFRAGAVLVGSVAFQAYANMLGVCWPSGQMRTQDIDLAADPIGVVIATEGVRLADILAEAGGFAAVPGLLWKDPATSFVRKGLRVDLLTPMRGRPNDRPVYVDRIGAHGEPLRFVDFLLENAQPAVLLSKDGIVVNVPDPARFALHKLAVSERRDAAWATKARKDVSQAESLLEILLEDRPGALSVALEQAHAYHAKFHRAILTGARKLPEGLQQKLNEMAVNIG